MPKYELKLDFRSQMTFVSDVTLNFLWNYLLKRLQGKGFFCFNVFLLSLKIFLFYFRIVLFYLKIFLLFCSSFFLPTILLIGVCTSCTHKANRNCFSNRLRWINRQITDIANDGHIFAKLIDVQLLSSTTSYWNWITCNFLPYLHQQRRTLQSLILLLVFNSQYF